MRDKGRDPDRPGCTLAESRCLRSNRALGREAGWQGRFLREWPWVPGGHTAPHLVPLALVASFTELQASLRLPPGFIGITSHWYPGLQGASLAFWVLFRGLSPSLY